MVCLIVVIMRGGEWINCLWAVRWAGGQCARSSMARSIAELVIGIAHLLSYDARPMCPHESKLMCADVHGHWHPTPALQCAPTRDWHGLMVRMRIPANSFHQHPYAIYDGQLDCGNPVGCIKHTE